MANRPTVKAKRDQSDLILFVEGAGGQRVRFRVCGGDIVRVFVEHDELVEIEPPTEVKAVRWWS